MLNGLTKLLFGYDVFVSYPYTDGRAYAEALTAHLENLDFSCFLDKNELPYGDQLSRSLQRGIKRSKAFLLVGTNGVLDSIYVDLEIKLAMQNRRLVIVPVDVDQIREKVKWPPIQELPWINEPAPTDHPSSIVLEKIRGHFKFTRRNSLARRVIGVFAVILMVITLVAVWQWREAVHQKRVALAGGLAGQAELIRDQLDQGLEKSTLLAIESVRRYLAIGQVPAEAYQVLRKSASLLPQHVLTLNHGSRVRDVAFGSDGKLIATAGDDGAARVWSLDQGEELWSVHQDAKLGAIAINEDGSHLATVAGKHPTGPLRFSGGSRIVHLWTRGQSEPDALVHEGPVTAAVFDSGGQLLATTTRDSKCALFWSITRAEQVGSFCEGGGRLQIAPVPGEPGILISGQQSARNRDFPRSQRTSRFQQFHLSLHIPNQPTHPSAETDEMAFDDGWQEEGARAWLLPDMKITRYAINQQGRFLAFLKKETYGTLDETINIWALPKRTGAARPVWPARTNSVAHQNQITDLAFSPDGFFLASASRDDTARVWEANTGREVFRIGHAGDVNAVSYSPDGHLLATASSDGTARVWRLAGSETANVTNKSPVRSVAWSHGGRWLAMLTARTIRVWDAKQGALHWQDKIQTTKPSRGILGRDPRAPVFSPDDRQVTVAGKKSARRWLLTDGTLDAEIVYRGLDGRVELASVGPRGRLVAAVAGSQVGLWDIESAELIAMLNHKDKVRSAAFQPDGRRLATVAANGQILLWDTKRGNRDTALTTDFKARALAFSPDGTLLAAGGQNSQVCLWSTETWLPQPCFATASRPPVVGIDFSPDNRYLVWGKGPPQKGFVEVGIIALGSGREVTKFEGNAVRVLSFSASGRYLAISDQATYLPRIFENWDSEASQVVADIDHHRAWAFAFTPDESLLASGAGTDDLARITAVGPEFLIKIACNRLSRNLTTDEWRKYLIGERYRHTCENLPEGR